MREITRKEKNMIFEMIDIFWNLLKRRLIDSLSARQAFPQARERLYYFLTKLTQGAIFSVSADLLFNESKETAEVAALRPKAPK